MEAGVRRHSLYKAARQEDEFCLGAEVVALCTGRDNGLSVRTGQVETAAHMTWGAVQSAQVGVRQADRRCVGRKLVFHV